MPHRSLEAGRAATAKHYRENVAYYRQRNKDRLALFRQIIANAKSNACLDCHQTYHPYVMDFDHVRGVKKFNIAAISNISSEKALRDEIAKCDVVCSNCHRMRTLMRNPEWVVGNPA